MLLPVHAGIDARHLREALQSLLDQTRRADEVVIVEDGPLPDEHCAALDAMELQHSSVVRIALPVNGGAGIANQTGLAAATGTWIAKMDADDISVPHRLAQQLAEVTAIGADVCGGAMLEFDSDSGVIAGVRRRPTSHESIALLMRFNNPINHPTAFFRRDLARAVGGYPPMRYMQDYVLFARMLRAGGKMTNLDAVLVLFRAGAGVIKRRRAPGLARLEWELQRELRSLGVTGNMRRMRNLVARTAYRHLPTTVVGWIHRRALVAADGPPESAPRGRLDR